MCGICGIAWSDGAATDQRTILQRMCHVMTHRGPDAQDQYFSEQGNIGVALGFRRLSIIDLDHGMQPIANEDETVWMVFNGEIYNYVELRQTLEAAGHRFKTRSDSEVIVHLYEQHGTDCFAHLNGMFAIAIWDSRLQQLVLARDRLGQKPLVYLEQSNRLIFASELKSILEVPGVPRDVDVASLMDYLTYQYIPHPRSILQGFAKLPPGHFGIYRRGKLTLSRYWKLEPSEPATFTEQEAVTRLEDLLSSSVDIRMRSDVPLGAFLSGGIDSSVLVALMQEKSAAPIKTFSIGFNDSRFDESGFAREVAEHLGTDHYEQVVTPNCTEILDQLLWHFDEPFGDSSAIPTWYVSKFAREHVKVAISGDGSDELFAGYPRYRLVDKTERLRRSTLARLIIGSRIWDVVPRTKKQSRFNQLLRYMKTFRESTAHRYLDWISVFNAERRRDLMRNDWWERVSGHQPSDFLTTAIDGAKTRDPLSAVSLGDLVTYLPCDLMTKVDIASMAHGLECRQPFLDHRILSFSASCSIRHKYQQGLGKVLLRKAFRDRLPASVWQRPKQGFAVPLDEWFRNDLRGLVGDLLLSESALCYEYFNIDAVRSLVAQHQRREYNHASRLWLLLVLELWLRKWTPSQMTLPRENVASVVG